MTPTGTELTVINADEPNQPEAQPASGEGVNARQNIQIHLRKIPLLANLTDEEVLRIKGDFRFKQYNKRDVVLQKGGSGDGLLFLLSGQMQVIDVTEDGRAIGLRMLVPGDFLAKLRLSTVRPVLLRWWR